MTKKQAINKFFKAIFEKSKRILRHLFACFLLGALLVFALKTVPDWLITNVKPKNLNEDQAITYFCTIIASFVTIVGIFLTLEHNQKMVKDQLKENADKFKEERRLSVLPFITISKIIVEKRIKTDAVNDYEIIDEDETEENNIYDAEAIDIIEGKEYNQIIISINENDVCLRTSLTEYQINIIKNGVSKENKKTSYVYVPLYLINSGNGTAVGCKIHIYYKEDGIYQKYMTKCSPIHLLPSQKFKLCFFCEDRFSITKEYKMRIEYEDIYGNKYYQDHYFYKSPTNSFKYSTIVNQKRKIKKHKFKILKQA